MKRAAALRLSRVHIPALLLIGLACGVAGAAAIEEPLWARGLDGHLLEVQERSGGQLGLYVHHIGRNEAYSFHGHEPWYLASGVKVPVAIAVLRDVEDGKLELDSTVRLLPTDFVDGAGRTNDHPAGTRLTVSYLLEQMIIHSDNTATDVLIRIVGLERINVLANELFGTTDFVMTTLAEVRRMAYGMFDPRAAKLTSEQLLAVRRAGAGTARVLQLATILGAAPEDLLVPDLDSAFRAYYARRVNTASLAAYARMLAALVNGDALGRQGTGHLLDLMSRVRTGQYRILAALPEGAKFAHKTGTQHRVACDMGIVTTRVGDAKEQVILAACVHGAEHQQDSDRALREAGAALVDAGVITLPSQVAGDS